MGSKSSKVGGVTLEEITGKIQNREIKNIIAMCGAGISTSAGIPDFRSPSTGLYFKLRKYNLPYPEAIFTYDYFKKDPTPFYHLVRELFPDKLTPTPTHRLLTLLHEKGTTKIDLHRFLIHILGLLKRIYTQNIDALEHIAGVPEDKIIEAHGTFHRSYCTRCKKQYSLAWLKERVFQHDNDVNVPKCEDCENVVRPDIVFFGESLPRRYFQTIKSDFSDCDLLIIIGTSLTVTPFANLIHETKPNVPRMYLNLSKPGEAGNFWAIWLSVIFYEAFNNLTLKFRRNGRLGNGPWSKCWSDSRDWSSNPGKVWRYDWENCQAAWVGQRLWKDWENSHVPIVQKFK